MYQIPLLGDTISWELSMRLFESPFLGFSFDSPFFKASSSSFLFNSGCIVFPVRTGGVFNLPKNE